MRLQSAIFTLGDTLFTPDGAAREGGRAKSARKGGA